MKWIPTCREASELASRAMDVRLRLTERMALRVHLAICENCARFNRQLQEMRRLLRTNAAPDERLEPGLTPEARQRIETEMQKSSIAEPFVKTPATPAIVDVVRVVFIRRNA